jgi:hypothetical protein
MIEVKVPDEQVAVVAAAFAFQDGYQPTILEAPPPSSGVEAAAAAPVEVPNPQSAEEFAEERIRAYIEAVVAAHADALHRQQAPPAPSVFG